MSLTRGVVLRLTRGIAPRPFVVVAAVSAADAPVAWPQWLAAAVAQALLRRARQPSTELIETTIGSVLVRLLAIVHVTTTTSSSTTTSSTTSSTSSPSTTQVEDTPETDFSQIVSDVAVKQNQKDVTMPFYFICLLHLCNEKTLKLTQAEDGTINNFSISTQG